MEFSLVCTRCRKMAINVTRWSHWSNWKLEGCTLMSGCESRWSKTRVTRASCFTIVTDSRLWLRFYFVLFGFDHLGCIQINPGLGELLPVLEWHDIYWFHSWHIAWGIEWVRLSRYMSNVYWSKIAWYALWDSPTWCNVSCGTMTELLTSVPLTLPLSLAVNAMEQSHQ